VDCQNNKETMDVAWNMWEQWDEALHRSHLNWKTILEKDINDKIQQTCAVGPGQLAQVHIGLMQSTLDHQLSLPMTTKQRG